jgi:hypothetical protein
VSEMPPGVGLSPMVGVTWRQTSIPVRRSGSTMEGHARLSPLFLEKRGLEQTTLIRILTVQ